MSWIARIALRYLFAKKRQEAIHIVTGVSTAGIIVVTAAMVCVLSVMNGFEQVVTQLFSQFDSPLKVVPSEGKWITKADSLYTLLSETEGVEVVSREIRETALIQYKDHRMPATLMGVDEDFNKVNAIDSIITDGKYCLYDGAFERAVLGIGLAHELGIQARFVGGIRIYAPKRFEQYHQAVPFSLLGEDEDWSKALNQGTAYIAGTFAVNQAEYDNQLMLVSLGMAQHLFDCDSATVSALHLKLTDPTLLPQIQKKLQERLSPTCRVLNRYEQQADFFRIVKVEKLLTMLLLFLIMLLAGFSTVGSLTMLIIDKKDDIRTLHNLGASMKQIRLIFFLEGVYVGLLGAVIGLIIGAGLCLIQQQFGLLTMGNGAEYIISAYPVQVQAMDIVYVLRSVLAITLLTSWIPARKIALSPLS